MRIITGLYKGRHFDIPRSFKARPTTDFAKENLFNVLNAYIDFQDSRALDLFSGTGSISLELLSRGCREVVSIEGDKDHVAFIRQCSKKLNTEKHTIIRTDVFRYLKRGCEPFDFIFADPPYALPNIKDIPSVIFNNSEGSSNSTMLTEGGIFVLEHGKDYNFESHPAFVEHRAYGSVNFSIFKNSIK